MAFAFGIEYGLADISRANAEITRELERQLQLMEQTRRIMGSSAAGGSSLLGGSSGGSNVVDSTRSEREFNTRFRSAMEKESRRFEARLGSMMRNTSDVSALVRGHVGLESARGVAELGRDIVAGAVGGSGVVGRVAAGAVGVFGGVAAGLAKAAPPVAVAYAISSVSDYLFGNPADKFMEKIEAYTKRGTGAKVDAKLKAAGVRSERARIDLIYPDPGDTGFDRAGRLLEDAESFDTAANVLLDADPQRAAQSLNIPGDVTRATIAKHVSRLMATDPRALRAAALNMVNRSRQRESRERSQAEYNDRNPEVASRFHKMQRQWKREEEREARALRDWSKG